jgi:hypothetical protein
MRSRQKKSKNDLYRKSISLLRCVCFFLTVAGLLGFIVAGPAANRVTVFCHKIKKNLALI